MLTHLRRKADWLRRSAQGFVYPPTCPLCRSLLTAPLAGDDASSLVFCETCLENLSQPVSARCGRCDAPVGAFLGTTTKCVHCRDDRFAFSSVVSVGVYVDGLKQAVLQAKEPGGRTLSMQLARLLWQRRAAELDRGEFDVLVPVPVHWWQRLTRSSGAQDPIADMLSRRLRVMCDRHAVAKIRPTAPQASLSPTNRRKNLRNAFRLRGGSVWRGRRVLLVDDVLTTGATAHQIARLFRDAGAEEVVVAVIARGLGSNFRFPSQTVVLSKRF